MIDTYNQQIQYYVSCTIRTNINTANHHFIVEQCNSKENISTPTKVSTGTQHKSSLEDNLGGGISRTVKTDDSLAVMEESILIPEATAKGYAEATDGDSVNLEQPNSKTRRGRVGKQMANTLTTSCNQGVVVSEPKIIEVGFVKEGKHQQDYVQHEDGICRTICQGTHGSGPHLLKTMVSAQLRQDGLGATGVVQIGNIYPDTDNFKNKTGGRVYSAEGLSPTLRTVTGGHNEPKVVEDWQTVLGSKQRNSYIGSTEECSSCITSACGAGGGMTPMLTDAPLETAKTKEFFEQVRGHEPMCYRIRKLTPRECFRLMDVDEVVIDKIQAAGISNSQQYKLAGNSIVVACLEKIFEQMFFPQYTNTRTLFG